MIKTVAKCYKMAKKMIKKEKPTLAKFITNGICIGFITKRERKYFKKTLACAARVIDEDGKLGWAILLNRVFVKEILKIQILEVKQYILCRLLMHELIHIALFEKIEERAYKLTKNERYVEKLADNIISPYEEPVNHPDKS